MYKDDIFYKLYKFSRARQYDMTMPASGVGILIEPSESRVGFVISNPFASVMQISVEVIDSDSTGIVLPSFSGPHFFSLLNIYGGIRQRWHFRGTGIPAASRWSIIEFLSNAPV